MGAALYPFWITFFSNVLLTSLFFILYKKLNIHFSYIVSSAIQSFAFLSILLDYYIHPNFLFFISFLLLSSRLYTLKHILRLQKRVYFFISFIAAAVAGFYYFSNNNAVIDFAILIFSFSVLAAAFSLFLISFQKMKIFIFPGILYCSEFLLLLHYPALDFFRLSFYDFFLIYSVIDLINASLLIIISFCSFLSNKSHNCFFYNFCKNPSLIIENGIIIDSNSSAEKLFIYPKKSLIGLNIINLCPSTQITGSESAIMLQNYIARTLKGEYLSFEWQYKKSDNTIFIADVNFSKYPYGDKKRILAVIKDITQRKKNESIAQIAIEAFENSFEGFFILDNEGVFKFANKSFAELLGYSKEEIIGENVSVFKANMPERNNLDDIRETLNAKGSWSGEVWNRKKNGDLFICAVSISIIQDNLHSNYRIVGTILDITESSRNKEKLYNYQNYDHLTGLIKKKNFEKSLKTVLSQNKKNIILFNLDINNFKSINDNFGFAKGDDLLYQYSLRLKNIIDSENSLCRYSIDEFILYCTDYNELYISLMIKKILSTVKDPFILSGEKVYITISIGVAILYGSDSSSHNFIKKANIALHNAKQKGKNSFSIYDNTMEETAQQKLKYENDLRSAILSDSILPYYQPKIDSATEEVIGMEALARWINKDNKIITPNNFISSIENTDMIYIMTEKILMSALEWTRNWNTLNSSNLRVAVNLSARHFQEYDLIREVEKIVSKVGIDTKYIEFEITESTFLFNSDTVFKVIKSLKSMGIHISLDDFGTGYSSLSYLRKIPLDSLKIDKSFIDDIEQNSQAKKLLKSIITIARDLDLTTVAEGVETTVQKEILKDMGCDILQGYLFSEPLPPCDFSFLLNSFNRGRVI